MVYQYIFLCYFKVSLGIYPLLHFRNFSKFIETESRMVVSRGEGRENGLFNGHRVSVLQDEEFWKWIVVMVAQQCEHT